MRAKIAQKVCIKETQRRQEMKKLTWISLVFMGLFFAASAFFAVPSSTAEEVLRYHCSNQVYRSIDKYKLDAFTKATGIKVKIKTASSDACIYAMMSGFSDLASSARALDSRHQDYGYTQMPFCKDHMAVFVNSSCAVEGLTEEQVQDIFSGDIGNWKAVGGPDLPIILIAPDKDTAANKNFRRMIMKRKELATDYIAYDSTGVIEAIKYFPCGAVSFISYGAIAGDPGVKPLKIDGMSPADKDYPYYQVFYYVTKGEPSGAVKQFIDFTFSEEGMNLITRHGMMPID
jgi:ABC-type phosphate transport system substrate-binding protein